MNVFFMNNPQLVWPIVLIMTWAFGEVGSHITRVPKITFYILFGFLFAKHQIGLLPYLNNTGIMPLISIISGLILFEFGYRINLRWIWNNPIILVTSIVESSVTFIAVFILSRLFGISTLVSLEFAAIFIATSPIVVLQIINQQQSSGQVTERILHLTALNCIFSIFAFKIVLGLMIFHNSGSLWQATMASIVMILFSTILGVVSALFLFAIMKRTKIVMRDSTVILLLTIILIVGVAKSLEVSPIIAALSFGFTARHLKIAMGKHQRHFGAFEHILTVVLFVVIPLNLDWHNVSSYISLGIVLFFSRMFIKVIIVSIFSYFSGISMYKGLLTGLALTPISIFVILLLDQSISIELALNQELLVISGVILFLELAGPCITQYSLIKAKENGPD